MNHTSDVRVAVLRAPGTNCDVETAAAFEQVGAKAQGVQIQELISGAKTLKDFQILAIPGGFSYGDDIASGRLVANELKTALKDELDAFIKRGKLVIGICNGFQILAKAGILPAGGADRPQEVTLTANDSGRFEDRWVYLKTEFSVCVWTQGIEEKVELPVAHAEGKFIPKDVSTLEELVGFGQIVFHYCDESEQEAGYPWNPNGSVGNIAGICDPGGRIFGLMPHPERYMTSIQHPRWTRGRPEGPGDGAQIFRNGVEWVKRHL
ncbi:MAG: phosphoribosylformylglycinamidine synthase I [Candidatus Omnitrophica bacterium]|nr:phosphoribosylformylglycinamidine synthase I [Candidatus Omnitrophota bacterium]